MPRRAFFCGITAALLWDIPVPSRLSDPSELDVGVPAGTRRIDAAGIRPHHLTVDAADVIVLRGARTSSLVRTWRDLAGCGLTVGELVAAGDHVLRRSEPTALERAVAAAAGRRGGAQLRSALQLLDARAESAPESELRVAMHGAGPPAPTSTCRGSMAPGDSWADPISVGRGRASCSTTKGTTIAPTGRSGSRTSAGSPASRSMAGSRCGPRPRTTAIRALSSSDWRCSSSSAAAARVRTSAERTRLVGPKGVLSR